MLIVSIKLNIKATTCSQFQPLYLSFDLLLIYLFITVSRPRQNCHSIINRSSHHLPPPPKHSGMNLKWMKNTPITPIFNSLLSQCKQKQNSFFIKVAAQLICLPSSLQTLSVSQHWARAHRYPCDSAPCTSVVCSSPEIVTVGEDGRIVVFRADHEGVVQTIGKIRRGI